ncbi:hypothetical protein FE783_19475 [Paenibacillus mesophilus]|uniref:hypothetical protein n=1 Tax=Paenibacillus mesophilus TaxID=2582849 RepID=UPI00110D28B5|nr:hypothetical protein [Paenibacillus mesophilus]TMV48133.1 hypothetical protein FE783_19475 [Paenibacillus mesophilus]
MENLTLSKSQAEGGGVEFELIDLGPQVHTVNTHRTAFGRDASGNTVAYTTLVGIPAKLLVTDVKTGKLVAKIPVEDTVNGRTYANTYVRGLAVQPDGTVYLAGTPSYLFKYVPGADRVQFVSAVNGSQLFDMKNGPDGILIGGTYSKSEAFEFDTRSGTLTSYGRIMDNESYAYSVAYDPERDDAYFGIGSHVHLIRYNRGTGVKTEIPLPEPFASGQFVFDMTVAAGKLFMRFSPSGLIALDLATGRFDDTVDNASSRLMSPKSPVEDKVYYTNNAQLGYYDVQTSQYVQLPVHSGGNINGFAFVRLDEPDYPGFTLVGMTTEAKLFKYNPETGHSSLTALDIEGEPTELQTAAKANDGTIYTSGYLSGGNACFDPFTGATVQYTNETLGYGQKLSATQTDRVYSYKDSVYFSAYTGMKVFEFDTKRPWNVQDKEAPNPRLLFSAYDVKYQDRGLAGTIAHDEGKLIIGTVPKYGMLGGALVIYDLISGEREAYWAPVERQSVTAVAYKDGFIYGGTCIWGGLGMDPVETEAKLFVWDMEKKEKVFEIVPVPGQKAVTELIAGPDGMIWGSAEGYLFVFDPQTRQVVHTQQLIPKSYTSTVWRDTQFQIGTDGNVYGVQGSKFFRIDAASKQMTIIRDAGKRNWLAQDDFGHFYLTEGPNLLKLTIPGLIVRPVGAELTASVCELSQGCTAELFIKGLLEQGRTVDHLERRNPMLFSSDPAVADFENGKLVAGKAGTAEIWARVDLQGTIVETNRITVTSK